MSVIPLKGSVYAHADILNSIFIALRDGIRRGVLAEHKAHPIMEIASRGDCRVARTILEILLERLREETGAGQSTGGHRR